jgi:23S rRNA pseudouridine1911/1915/1917 synthase
MPFMAEIFGVFVVFGFSGDRNGECFLMSKIGLPFMSTPAASSSPPFCNKAVLFEDNHLIAVFKPAGLLTQADATGDASLLEMTRAWLKEKYKKPGNVFLGLVHRLDRPVSGVVLFAKTSKAAGRLSEQFRLRSLKKEYLALVESGLEPFGTLSHFVRWENDRAIASGDESDGGKAARLSYRVRDSARGLSLIEISLETGRKHQIRSQFAAAGFPIVGDKRYGSGIVFQSKGIGLMALRLQFSHPVKREDRITVEVPPDLGEVKL